MDRPHLRPVGPAPSGEPGNPAPWTLADRLKQAESELAELRRRARDLERTNAAAVRAKDWALVEADASRRRHERHVEVLEERVRQLGQVVAEEVSAGLEWLEAAALEVRMRRVGELVAAEVASILVDSLILSASAPGPLD